MPQDITAIAEAINLPDAPVVLVSAPELAALLREIRALHLELDQFRADVALERARDRKRIAAIESRIAVKSSCGKKQEARLAKIEHLLIARGNEPLTFSEVGKYLELGSRDGGMNTRRQNMTLLGKIINADDRFRVFESNTRKGSKMIALSGEYFSRGPPAV